MAISYVKSNQIKAFPVVNRNTAVSGDTYAKHTSEATLTGIVNKLINSDGFVITPRNKIKLDSEFAFNIFGYYFNVASLEYILEAVLKNVTDSSPWLGSVYAGIDLVENGQWTELMGGDESTESGNTGEPAIDTYQYKSVKFTTSLEDLTNTSHYIELFLLSRNNSNTETWCIFPSFLSPVFEFPCFNSRSINDCKELKYKFMNFLKNNNYIKFSGISFKIDGGDLDIK